ncbi:MAG TPA: prepilin-type N-terminal cleavage/methylation domain-containing protein [Candidatus Solibacter sp.]|nr:prepilin-type N-terminal cleavage/methylation domain-containing protein [Candidatus Solibacter sp.]
MNRLKKSMHGQLPWRKRAAFGLHDGFTLIELMIVITIILILIGMAAQRYGLTIQHSREAVLKHDLQVMREAIDNYTLDKQAAPQSLDDLQQAGYLRDVPVDPMTRAKDWVPQFDNVVMSPDQVTTGMVDVHSNSERTSPFDGTPYSSW